MNLQKSERFQEDIQRYSLAIESLDDENLKKETRLLLNKLIAEVKKMDTMYLDMVYSHQLGSTGKDFKENISSIRKTLEKKIKGN